jgi:hypothetical protein
MSPSHHEPLRVPEGDAAGAGDGVVKLEALGRHHDPDWQRLMGHLYPGKTPREILEPHLSWWAGLEGRRAALPKDRSPLPPAGPG